MGESVFVCNSNTHLTGNIQCPKYNAKKVGKVKALSGGGGENNSGYNNRSHISHTLDTNTTSDNTTDTTMNMATKNISCEKVAQKYLHPADPN